MELKYFLAAVMLIRIFLLKGVNETEAVFKKLGAKVTKRIYKGYGSHCKSG